MLRGPLVPTVAAGVVAAGVAFWLQQLPGLWGSLLAVAVVVAFFSASLLVMGRTARTAPANVMAVALLTYVTKVGLLGLMLVLLQDATWLSGEAFGLTALLCAFVWIPLGIRSYSRARTLVFDEPKTLREDPS
jgi:ATP synthase protein I